MDRRIPWLWILLLGLVLFAPGPAGRFLLDVIGGLTLTLILLPLIVAGGAVLAWQILRRRLRTCPACGFTSLAQGACPVCGGPLPVETDSPPSAGAASGFVTDEILIRVQSPLRGSGGAADFGSEDVGNLTIDVDASTVVEENPSNRETDPNQKNG